MGHEYGEFLQNSDNLLVSNLNNEPNDKGNNNKKKNEKDDGEKKKSKEEKKLSDSLEELRNLKQKMKKKKEDEKDKGKEEGEEDKLDLRAATNGYEIKRNLETQANHLTSSSYIQRQESNFKMLNFLFLLFLSILIALLTKKMM